MKKQAFLLGVLFLCCFPGAFSQNYLLDQYDVHQYILDLEISNLNTRVSGNVTMNATVMGPSMDTAAIELIDSITSTAYMIVDSVWFNGIPASFEHTGWFVLVPLSTPVAQGQLFSLQLFYHGNGAGCSLSLGNGIQRKNYLGIVHTFNSSQPVFSKFWWPCKENMTDKADSVTFIITTDSINKSGSNGLLRSVEYPGGGKVRYQWETKYPISPYLVSFVVGPITEYIDYAHLPSNSDSLLLYNLLFPSSPYYPMYLNGIEKTKQLLVLNSTLLGDYPFKKEKYGYCIIGISTIGIEHQTMCTMGYMSLDTITTPYPYAGTWFLTAHELAHQWFGDAVICDTWNDAWLVDGFASYMEYVALQNMYNQASADAWMEDAHASIRSEPGGSVWIPDSLVTDIANIFDYRLIYKKGAAILHILRHEINNDSLFFSVLKHFIATYEYGSASAENFRQIAETTTGMDFSTFFDQWYYGQGYPIFSIHWVQTSDTLVIRSEQTSSTTLTPLFQIHFDIRVFYPGGDTTIRLFQSASSITCSVPFCKPIDSVTFDPGIWLIQQHSVHMATREDEMADPIRIFPNPTTGDVSLVIDFPFTGDPIQALVFDAWGKLLLQEAVHQGVSTLGLGDFPCGLYLIQLRGLPGKPIYRIVKQ